MPTIIGSCWTRRQLHFTWHFHLMFQPTKKRKYVDELQSCTWIHYNHVKSLAILDHPNTIPICQRHCDGFGCLKSSRNIGSNGNTSQIIYILLKLMADPCWDAKRPSLCCALVLLQRVRPTLWTRCLATAAARSLGNVSTYVFFLFFSHGFAGFFCCCMVWYMPWNFLDDYGCMAVTG